MRAVFLKILLSILIAMPAFAAGKPHLVVIENVKFNPETLHVKAGETVVWENKDFFPHTATSEKKAFDSKEIPANGTWKFIARKKGTFPYLCKLHPNMKGVLVVE